MTQELPRWVEDKKTDPPKRRPSPKDVAKAKQPWVCTGCRGKVAPSLQRCPVCGNAKPKSALAPKVEPKEPETPRLHVRVRFEGEMTFMLEGPQAEGVGELLKRGADAEEIISTLDPWSSGAAIKQTIDILEDPQQRTYNAWHVREEQGQVEHRIKNVSDSSFYYSLSDTKKPHHLDWDKVPRGGQPYVHYWIGDEVKNYWPLEGWDVKLG